MIGVIICCSFPAWLGIYTAAIDPYAGNDVFINGVGFEVTGFSNYTLVDSVTPTPTNFICPSLNNQSIYCSWDAEPAEKYLVFRNNTNIANTTDTFYNDTGLLNNTGYSHYVRAFNSSYGQTLSNQSSILTNLTLNNIAPVSPITSSINISLSSPAITAILTEGSNTFSYTPISSIALSNCTLFLKGVSYLTHTNVTSGNQSNFTVDLTPDDDYFWQVKCFDTTGANGTSEIRVFSVVPQVIGKTSAGTPPSQAGKEQQIITPINQTKAAEETPVDQARTFALDSINQAGSRFDMIWKNLPILGTLDFKQIFFAGAILFLAWSVIKTGLK